MPKGLQILVAVVVVALCLLSLYQLLALQYRSGDAYPPYSTYRPDPLGALALYDALDSLSGSSASRNITELSKVDLPEGATLVFAGATVSPDQKVVLDRLEEHASQGGRLLILMRPYTGRSSLFSFDEENDDEEEESADEGEESEDSEPEETEMDDDESLSAEIAERWGFDYQYDDSATGSDGQYTRTVRRSDAAPESLPRSLAWHSARFFIDFEEEWNPVYAYGDRAAIIQRSWGRGEIVLVSDNYHITNEALRANRESAYLTWLIGDAQQIIFDETHLGVARRSGIMTLLVQYRLIPVLLACIFLVLLFIWRNAVSLVPRRAPRSAGETDLSEYTAIAGMANLSRRAVPKAKVLDACWNLYQQPAVQHRSLDEKREVAVQQVLAKHRDASRAKKNSVTAYNRIIQIVNERKPHS